MKCPKCNSEKIQFISNTTNQGFSNKNATKGCLCFGIPGLLFGFCNSGKKETSEFWVCNNCGLKFQKSEVEEKERRIEQCKGILSGATKDEIKDLSTYISKAESKVDSTANIYMKELENENLKNEDIIKGKKNRKVLYILGIVAGIVSLFCFANEYSFLGLMLLGLFLWNVISYKKSADTLIDKFGSEKLKELKEEKNKAVDNLERLESIAKAQEDLQDMVANEK